MSRKPGSVRRKLITLDPETFNALELLRRDRMATFDELADEAFRDLLNKHGRPTDLRTALRQSARAAEPAQQRAGTDPPRQAPSASRRRRKESAT